MAYRPLVSTAGTRPTSTSRIVPPPTAVMAPRITRLRRPEPLFQGLAGASDAEQAQPGGVGQIDGQGIPVQGLAEEERDERPEQRLPPGSASR